MEDKKYYSDRTGTSVAINTPNIASDCNVISFVNDGDTPCYIESADGNVRRFLDQFQEVSFGSDLPEITETTKFNIVFSAVVTTQKVYIERVRYVEQPC